MKIVYYSANISLCVSVYMALTSTHTVSLPMVILAVGWIIGTVFDLVKN